MKSAYHLSIVNVETTRVFRVKLVQEIHVNHGSKLGMVLHIQKRYYLHNILRSLIIYVEIQNLPMGISETGYGVTRMMNAGKI